ncbi:helix-turn-helix domain-containing protein [Sinorhizobium numidicum]|uniref:Helix-turn-helix domain-containing protein n=2 Tax=Sinorhizobium numidicum TaxID=680248 RepID=A0ABY8D2Y4_9HYPH|nr:helix-turn-helix domain-containing protein [Sinorhizobium numidicum]WEX85260.1 helix-turn-helix domain-containing protein [Sinorhizobium numidicum]
MLDWSQAELAERSGVSEPTIKRLEASDGELGGRTDTAQRIVGTLESAGVLFLDGPYSGDGGPGVRLRSVDRA